MGQEVQHLVHQVDPHVLVLDGDVHMHPADQQAANHTAEGAGQGVVALLVRVLLPEPVGEWVG